VTVEIRHPDDAELRAAMVAANTAFGSELVEADYERERVTLPTDRAHVAFDGGTPVGLAGAYAFDLSIPGGELPCAGVTWVGVLPTHRRRDFVALARAEGVAEHRAGAIERGSALFRTALPPFCPESF
jgi:hypothetical protein